MAGHAFCGRRLQLENPQAQSPTFSSSLPPGSLDSVCSLNRAWPVEAQCGLCARLARGLSCQARKLQVLRKEEMR